MSKTMEQTHEAMDKAEKAFQRTLIDAQAPIITMLCKAFDLSPTEVATVMGKAYVEAGSVCLFVGLGGSPGQRDCAKHVAEETLLAAFIECKKHINPEDRI